MRCPKIICVTSWVEFTTPDQMAQWKIFFLTPDRTVITLLQSRPIGALFGFTNENTTAHGAPAKFYEKEVIDGM